jgi:hypothetical protein
VINNKIINSVPELRDLPKHQEEGVKIFIPAGSRTLVNDSGC